MDSRIRKMFHAYYKMERYNNENTTITPYNLKYNAILNKWFYKKPVLRIGGQEIVLRRIRFGKPPQFILDRYRNLEVQRKQQMMERFMQDIRRQEIQEVKKAVNIDEVINTVASKYQLYESKRSRPHDVVFDDIKIKFGFKVSTQEAKYIKGEAERIIREKNKEMKERISAGTIEVKEK